MERLLFILPFLFVFCVSKGASGALATSDYLQLNERVVMLPVNVDGKILKLETTLYTPSGKGPFPLLLINHGKNPGTARDQTRSKHFWLARVFVQKGYAVAIPMREGFSKSEGHYPQDGCDVLQHANDGAKDALAVLDALKKMPFVERTRILIAGQSDGGLVTMAMASHHVDGVKGMINFSGGVKMSKCARWAQNLVEAYKKLGEHAGYPSLWFYGDNDRLWPIPLPQEFFNAYRSNAKGPAMNVRMIDIGTFAKNSHYFADSQAGVGLWSPQVEIFSQTLGLPF